jgi:hypothetical protein
LREPLLDGPSCPPVKRGRANAMKMQAMVSCVESLSPGVDEQIKPKTMRVWREKYIQKINLLFFVLHTRRQKQEALGGASCELSFESPSECNVDAVLAVLARTVVVDDLVRLYKLNQSS